MTIEKSILQALQQKVIEAVAASTVPTLPIKFVDVAFTVPNDQKWLELIFIPNNAADRMWGDEEVYRGIMRLVLHWPNNGAGAYKPLELISSILSSFNKEERIGGLLQILNKPKLMTTVQSGSENWYPATVEYTVFSLA